MRKDILQRLSEVNRELWLILSLFIIAGILNNLVAQHGFILNLYALPTIFSAYVYGRRHAVLTALASICIVVILTYVNPAVLSSRNMVLGSTERWFDITIWGGILMVTAYAMGTLYERNDQRLRELRNTYNGVLMILRHFISKDKYTQNHSYRVSVYATKIASEMGFDRERLEDVRASALLHDIGKLDISRDLLYKAAKLTEAEYEEVKLHVQKGINMLEPVGGSLRRVLPIILSHHDRFDGNGYTPKAGDAIPIESRILAVADSYDAMTSDRPYRKAMSAFEARDLITQKSGIEFDPDVVRAFNTVFSRHEMEIPEVVV
ncbi:metal dependent phosphohydrolase [Candidatus Koribacter versatilis Ellin345]|uniref:Metal dependent phosphohydrolase n=1 Tax=Koribacter versatilis (strain Ellin345) TaxID=204669 RepID=Q1II97_KORVE|nr:HD-GYP domain-containing protein [Candidatus Koribacter versatilis]ABF43403.1 metal dependent phosphohydrolase [Candidatus Koribacter versatilis Ellin345]